MIDGTFDVVGAAGALTFFGHLPPDRLSHGYLFTGPAGVGKKTFARRFAQSLLCVTPKSTLLGYCERCSGCTHVIAGTHPDLYAMEGQLKIGDREAAGFHEDEMTARDLVRQLSMHSYAGGKRVFVLGDADFTREAANALLKFFEEPPAGVVLIVTTSQPGRLLATIRSRLVDVGFGRLTNDEIETALARQNVPAERAARAAEIANGNLARAKDYVDEGEGEGATRDAALTWFYAAVRGHDADHSQWATRATLEDGLDVIKTLVRDWLVIGIGGARAPLLARDQTAALGALPSRDAGALLRTLAAIGDAERIARTNVTPALVAGLVRMAVAPADALSKST